MVVAGEMVDERRSRGEARETWDCGELGTQLTGMVACNIYLHLKTEENLNQLCEWNNISSSVE